ncbi:MAG TPA: glycosyltransferase family 4 protein, partial [Acidobacteriaceae bacterium]|nr:glycosyltransferase family 4 protein [Acidobacteriaceae bacterium]
GVPSARVHVVYNGLDMVPYADNAARQKGPLAITTIGNIRQVKGHDIFVQAAAIVHAAYPEVCFTVAGEVLEPEYFAHLQQLVDHLGLRENFVFLGKITDLHAHLQTAAIFVLPSRSEGFSNALIEAMAAGLPCVATDVGGNAEAISHGENGLIVPPEDAPALAGAMLSLLQDTSFAANLSIAARRTVERQFTADAMVRNLVDRFRRLLETEPNETA